MVAAAAQATAAASPAANGTPAAAEAAADTNMRADSSALLLPQFPSRSEQRPSAQQLVGRDLTKDLSPLALSKTMGGLLYLSPWISTFALPLASV
jgi:hypothetical protein